MGSWKHVCDDDSIWHFFLAFGKNQRDPNGKNFGSATHLKFFDSWCKDSDICCAAAPESAALLQTD